MISNVARVLLMQCAALDGAGWSYDAGGGGSFDSNLNIATQDGEAEAAFRLDLWGSIGGWIDLTPDLDLELYAEIGRTEWLGFSELSAFQLGLGPSLSWWVGNGTTLRLGAYGGWSFFGDPERNGPNLRPNLAIRQRLLAGLSLEARVGLRWRGAIEPIYAEESFQSGLRLNWATTDARWAVWLGYLFDLGQYVVYQTTAPTAQSTQSTRGRKVRVFSDTEAVSETGQIHTISFDGEVRIWEPLIVGAGWNASWIGTPDGTAFGHGPFLAISFRG